MCEVYHVLLWLVLIKGRLSRRFGESAKIVTGESRTPLLTLRLASLVIMVALLTMHLRSLRVFRWEHSVTGGLVVTYFVATLGLTMCAGTQRCGAPAFQAYLSGTGSALMALNAAAIWRRWKRAGELTRVVAELLAALGVQLRRQVRIKVFLSVAAAITLLIDFIFSPILQSPSAKTTESPVAHRAAQVTFNSEIISYDLE